MYIVGQCIWTYLHTTVVVYNSKIGKILNILCIILGNLSHIYAEVEGAYDLRNKF